MTAALSMRLRDVRVHRGAAPVRALAFARRRLLRADRRVADGAPLGVTFLHAAPAPGAPVQRLGAHVAVTFVLRPRLVLASRAVRPAQMMPATAPAGRGVLHMRVIDRGEHLVERVRARGVRVEAGPPGVAGAEGASGRPGAPAPATAPGRAWHPPVRTVVVRRGATAPAAEGSVPAPLAPPGAAEWRSAAEAPLRAAAPGTGALDLGRVTDQVIAAIDRRIVVQRERLGRV